MLRQIEMMLPAAGLAASMVHNTVPSRHSVLGHDDVVTMTLMMMNTWSRSDTEVAKPTV